MPKILRFKSKSGYMKYLAFGHLHGVFTEKVRPKIIISGHLHKVKHCEICKSTTHHTHAHHLQHPQHNHTIHTPEVHLPRIF